MGDNASQDNEERPESPSTPAPIDHEGVSPTPSTPLPTSEDFDLPSTPAPMDHDGGSPTPSTPLPTSKDLFISTDHSPSPSIDLPETASSNRRGSPLLAVSESHINPVHNRQGEGSLEISLALLINATFQSHLISSPHLGTVNPSHLSLPLSLLGAGNNLGEGDIMMDDLTSDLSSIEDEDSGGLTITFFLHLDLIKFTVYYILEHSPVMPAKKDVQLSDDDDTDDEGQAKSCVFAFVFCRSSSFQNLHHHHQMSQ